MLINVSGIEQIKLRGGNVMKHWRPACIFLVLLLMLGCSFGCETTAPEPDITPEDSTDISVPSMITITTFDVGSGGYVATASLGEYLRQKENVTFRVIPHATDLGRVAPVKAGSVDVAMTGGGAVAWMQLGMEEAADPGWGPQPFQLVAQGLADYAWSMCTSDPDNITTVKDLKGKKVAYQVGGFGNNKLIEAWLAFGELTWDDVEIVEYPSLTAMLDGLLAYEVDASYIPSFIPKASEIEASAMGLHYLEAPPFDDKDAWARAQEIFPLSIPINSTDGAGLSPDKPIRSMSVPYPTFVVYPEQDVSVVYHLTRMIYQYYDEYKDLAPLLKAMSIDKALLKHPVHPWHEGAVLYFKEIGVWDDELDAYNQSLLKRDEELALVWDKALEEFTKLQMAHSEFKDFWLDKLNDYLEN